MKTKTANFGISKTAASAFVRMATGLHSDSPTQAALAKALQRFGMLPQQASGPLGMFSADDIKDACTKHKAAIAGAIKTAKVSAALRREAPKHRPLTEKQIKRLSRKADKEKASWL